MSKPPSQRQLRVGEEIKHILSDLFLQNAQSSYHPSLEESTSLTISEVKMSPDLKSATVYVASLGGSLTTEYIKNLNEIAPKLRFLMNKKLTMKYSPALYFKNDSSYETVGRLNNILHNIAKERDLLQERENSE